MIKIENLTVLHAKDLTPLIEDLSLLVGDEERVALIGEEGNGKSTLLRILAGDEGVRTYAEISGAVRMDRPAGYLPQELPERERGLSAYAFFSESPAFFLQSPAELGALASNLSLSAEAFFSEQRMADFSGGERVKLQLARILMERPGALLLDEPSNDLDGETVVWLEDFLVRCGLCVLFVSHDEALLSRVATGVLLLERLRKRQAPRATYWPMGYGEFAAARESSFSRQERIARKEREERQARMERYERIRRQVERDQNAISRQNPSGGRLLKKKMHAVMSMGRRFEREDREMTAMPEREEAIFSSLTCKPLPPDKTVLALALPELRAADRLLAQGLFLRVRGREKLALIGRNGAGKSTLLRRIAGELSRREDLRVFYMPQDPSDLLRGEKTPVEMLSPDGDAATRERMRTFLGAMRFTAEEMSHPCAALSGGQKAKLMFLMMAKSEANVLLLDEPTRNLSPLSGPVVRRLFADYPGCLLAVTHDRIFIEEVCNATLLLTKTGLERRER